MSGALAGAAGGAGDVIGGSDAIAGEYAGAVECCVGAIWAGRLSAAAGWAPVQCGR